MVVGLCFGASAAMGAASASAGPIRPMATAEFGVSYTDQGNNGQCHFEGGGGQTGESWATEGTWTSKLVIDTDNRSGGCEIKFAMNNVDGSLSGLNFSYWFIPNTGQCKNTREQETQIPVWPFAFRWFFMTPIVVDSDNRVGGCELTLAISGRNDIELLVRPEYQEGADPGQCPGADPVGGNAPRVIKAGQGVSLFYETDGRAGGCLLSFMLRHV